MFEITGGFDQLPKAFLKFVGDHITYNARVNRVDHDSQSVTAQYTSAAGEEITVTGDVLLNTATATSTAFIEFNPRLPESKNAAIRNVHYIAATKIVLVFDRPFWEDEGIFGGHSTTDLPSRMIFYPSHRFPSGLGVLLASYTFSDDSAKFLGRTNTEVKLSCLNDLAKIHGDYIRQLYRPDLGQVKRWSVDPYALGAFVKFKPYQLRYHDELGRPHHNLYFAGEHTELSHGWIDTSMRSAIKVAVCINQNGD